MHPTMKMPVRLYAERDPETNEKRWYETPGMGDEYVRADEVERLRADEVERLRAELQKMKDKEAALQGRGVAVCSATLIAKEAPMESTPENLPDRLMWFHEHSKTLPSVLIAAPLVEAAEEIKMLRATIRRFIDLAESYPDNPNDIRPQVSTLGRNTLGLPAKDPS
jgi:hypothetical protein